jgi:hypothetical protein
MRRATTVIRPRLNLADSGESAAVLLRFTLPAADHSRLSWKSGFDSDIGGDVPDWDNTESRESDEDAAWRDLVARFEEPTTTAGPVPWPDREDVPRPRPQPGRGPDRAGESPGAGGAGGVGVGRPQEAGSAPSGSDSIRDDEDAQGPGGNAVTRGARGADGIRGFDDEGVRGAFDADGPAAAPAPDVIQGARRQRRAGAHSTPPRRIRTRKAPPSPAPEDNEEHFIPPPPPPLPKLDPITKGAWAALFGGPGYLVVATAAGWSVPGIAAFCAVAAFVTGFAILVLRMNDSPGSGPDGPDDDGDDGAVV